MKDRCDVLGRTLVISLSGGVDSMVLSHCLLLLRHELRLNLSAIHVDYHRRPCSGLESAFVEAWAKEAELDLKVLRLKAANESRSDFEDWSRQARYAAYREAMQLRKAVAVVTGHHEDDAAENVLANLLMGRSLFHLPVLGPEAFIEDVRLWRPFCDLPKRALYAFASEHDIPYLRNNDLPSGRRAILHQQVIPALEDAFGERSLRNIARVGRSAKEWKMMIDQEILSPFWSKVLYFPHGAIVPLDVNWPPAVWEEAFVKIFHTMGCRMLSKRSLDRLLTAVGSTKSVWLPIHRKLILFVDPSSNHMVMLNSELFPKSPCDMGFWTISDRKLEEIGDSSQLMALLKGFLLVEGPRDLPREIAARLPSPETIASRFQASQRAWLTLDPVGLNKKRCGTYNII